MAMCGDLETQREFLLRHGLAFARAAAKVQGVRQIALLGSLLTRKERPKDIDLLLTVAEGLDLTEVAVLGRRLKGITQSRNLGADIFLADEAHTYLGRVCQWRDCRPGARLSCPALNCGLRQYLCDDLQAVALRPCLVSEPPLVLWPSYACCIDIPQDVVAVLAASRLEEW